MKNRQSRELPDKAKEAIRWGLVIAASILAGLLFSKIIDAAAETLHPVSLPADEPAEGVVRVPAVANAYLSPFSAEEIRTALYFDTYTEGDGPAPEWYDPSEPMAAEWNEELGMRNEESDIEPPTSYLLPPTSTDIGCPDWNLDTTLWGWDGHGAEAWELELFARVFYLEFWQPDMTLCEAGCDAILRLWESGAKGRTLGEVLSSQDEQGTWTYSVYPGVWAADYDADGLAWCRAYTAERFAEGPEWIAPYFRLDYYHSTDWSVPAYQIGRVCFSVGK